MHLSVDDTNEDELVDGERARLRRIERQATSLIIDNPDGWPEQASLGLLGLATVALARQTSAHRASAYLLDLIEVLDGNPAEPRRSGRAR